jgi:Holliday junction resolvase
MNLESETGRFIDAVADLSMLWRSIDLRIIAIRVEGQWHNLATTCLLDTRETKNVPLYTNLPHSDYVAAWQNVFDAKALTKVLADVGRGELKIDTETVLFLTGLSSEDASSYKSWNYSFFSLSERYKGEQRPWAAHQLLGTGDQGHTLADRLPVRASELDNSIRALQNPFDGLEGLASIFLGEADPARSGHSTIFKAIAPIPARLNLAESRLEDGRLQFAVISEAHAIANYCSLGFVATATGQRPISDSVQLSPEGWSTQDDKSLYRGHRELLGVQTLTLFLRVGNHPVDKATLIDPAAYRSNPRVQAYRVFDPDLELLHTFLNPESPAHGRRFERAVARLLALLGFHIDLLAGDGQLGDAVDLIAYAYDAAMVLAVECATGSIDAGGKLGKLIARARKIEAALAGHEVIPVLITSLDRQAISESELQDAASDRIAVLAQEDISELEVMLAKGSSLMRAVQYIRSRIDPNSIFLSSDGRK